MRFKIFGLICIIAVLSGFVSGFLISDQGTNVKEFATGNLLESGNLTILIYDNTTGGNEIYNQTFSSAIVNGSWNVMTDPDLEYGLSYWKDYQINGEDLDFDGNERLEFQSSVGMLNNVSFINFSLINSCAAGSSIRAIYANGSVVCETDDSGSAGSNITHLENLTNTNITSPSNRSILYYDSDESKWIDTLFETLFDLFFSGKTTDDLTEGSTNLYDNQSWNESYADSLYATIGSGGNESWNESYADSLYYGIDNPSSFYNSSDFVITDYYTKTQIGNFGFYNGTSFPYTHLSNFTDDIGASGEYTHLSNFTDNLGNRGYTSNLNFSNDAGYYNASDFDISDYYSKTQIDNFGYYNATDFDINDYSTTADIFAFGYYNSSDFVITDYFTKTQIENFDYYNSSDFDISDYFTSAEVLAFDYYNSTDFDINDYITSATLEGYNYYNATDFDINDYATNTKVDSLGNWSVDKSNYYNTTQTDVEIVSANTSMKGYVDNQVAGITQDNESWNESYADTQYLNNDGDTATGNYTFDTDTLHIDSSNDRVGIGTTSPDAQLQVYGSDGIDTSLQVRKYLDTDGGASQYASRISVASNIADTSSVQLRSFNLEFYKYGVGRQGGAIFLSKLYSDIISESQVDNIFGQSIGIKASTNNSKILNAYAVRLEETTPTGTIDNYYGYYAQDVSNNADNSYALYLEGGRSYFGGNVGIGTTTPSQKLEVNGSINISGSGASLIFPDGTTLDSNSSIGADNESWNQSFANTLYYSINNPSGFYNSTDFSITDYYTKAQIGDFNYYNASDFDISDYYSKTQIDNFGYYNATDFDINDYSTTADIFAFGYYNSSDFVITDYFTKTQIENFDYYNSSDFDISDYFTSAEVLAFDYYNSTDFDINDYITSATLEGYNYYNATDFDINDYATNTKVDSLGNWSVDKSNYYETGIVDSLGNWSADKDSYATTATIFGYGYYNSSDFVITDYYTKAQIGDFNYYNASDFDINDYMLTSSESNLNVNSSGYWDDLNSPSDINAADITDDGTYLSATGDTATGNYTFNTNTLHIDSTNGRVGIGTTNPGAKLEVAGNTKIDFDVTDSTYAKIRERLSSNNVLSLESYGGVQVVLDNNDNDADTKDFRVRKDSTTGNTLFIVEEGGNVGIGTTNPGSKLEVQGNLTVNGSVTATAYYYSSDRNLKKDINILENPLDKINQLEGVSFKWRADDSPSMGFIAQDVEKVFPELVKTDSQGSKSVQYGNLVALAVESIKEQQKQIEELKRENVLIKEVICKKYPDEVICN